ncbi:hypothetical protein PCE1_001830 [Barthelona sp. PCE]
MNSALSQRRNMLIGELQTIKGLQTVANNQFTLRARLGTEVHTIQIVLPANFPNSAPQIFVPGCTHWSLNPANFQLADNKHIKNWNGNSSSVKQTLDSFILTFNNPRPAPVPTMPKQEVKPVPVIPQRSKLNVDVTLPPVPTNFALINTLSVEQLRSAILDDGEFSRLLERFSYESEIRNLMQTVNAKIEAELKRVKEISHEDGELRESIRRLRIEQKTKYDEYQRLLNDLPVEAGQTDNSILVEEMEESEMMSLDLDEAMDNGEIEIDEFIDQYVDVRKNYHMKRIALDATS